MFTLLGALVYAVIAMVCIVFIFERKPDAIKTVKDRLIYITGAFVPFLQIYVLYIVTNDWDLLIKDMNKEV